MDSQGQQQVSGTSKLQLSIRMPSGLGFRVVYPNNGEANEKDSGKLDGHFGYRQDVFFCDLHAEGLMACLTPGCRMGHSVRIIN